MNWKLLHGIGSDDGPEKCYLTGYNGTGKAVSAGTPVCWDSSTADVRTFVAPATASFKLVAGVAEEAVGTAEYTSKIVAYGPVKTLTYGVGTNFVPGVSLILVNGKTYLAYGTDAELAGQLPVFVALATNATATPSLTKVFVRAI